METISRMINKGKESFFRAFKRFPETLLAVSVLVGIGIFTNHTYEFEDVLMKGAMALFIMGPWLATVTLFSEKKELKTAKKNALSLGVLLVGCIFYLLIPEEISATFLSQYMAMMGIGYLLFIMMPYFFKREGFSTYVLTLMIFFGLTYFIVGTLYAGLTCLIFSIESLFEVNVDYHIMADLAIITFGLIGVSFFLGLVPLEDEDVKVTDFNGILSKFVMWIGMPLLWAYMGVIYIYLIRIVMVWEWPKGVVGTLVLVYGFLAIVAQVLIEVLRLNNKWVEIFKTWFPRVFIVPWIMMIITMVIRIDAYGITLQRYVYIMIALVYLINTLFRGIKYNYTSMVLFCMAVIFLFVGTVGPLSGFQVSTRSQINRLTEILMDQDMLHNGEIVPNVDLTSDIRNDINSIVESLRGMETLDQVSYLPKDFRTGDMKDTFGFDYKYGRYYDNNRSFYFDTKNEGLMSIEGYDYIYTLDRAYGNTVIDEEGLYLWRFNAQRQEVQFLKGETLLYRESCISFFKDFKSDLLNNEQDETIIIDKSLDTVELKIIIEGLSGEESLEALKINWMTGYCLIKEKD